MSSPKSSDSSGYQNYGHGKKTNSGSGRGKRVTRPSGDGGRCLMSSNKNKGSDSGGGSDDGYVTIDKHEVYVGNIPLALNEDDIGSLFLPYGLSYIRRYLIKESKVYCFLEMKDESCVQRAVKEMDGYEISGRKLRVRASDCRVPRTPRSERPHYDYPDDDDMDGPPPLIPAADVHDFPPPLVRPSSRYVSSSGMKGHSNHHTSSSHNMPPSPVHERHSRYNNMHDQSNGNRSHRQRVSNMHSTLYKEEPASVTVYNFPYGTSESLLLQLFADYSPEKVILGINAPTGDKKLLTSAQVFLRNRDLAERAQMDLHKMEFMSRNIFVEMDNSSQKNGDVSPEYANDSARRTKIRSRFSKMKI